MSAGLLQRVRTWVSSPSGKALAAVGGLALAWRLGLVHWAVGELGAFVNEAVRLRKRRRRPAVIILVRHGESMANVDGSVYSKMADHRIPLTEKGRQQAVECGHKLRRLLGRNLRIKFFVSPYRRANQTLAHILRSFPDRSKYRIRTDPRLREQEFGKLRDFHHLTNNVLPARARFGRFFWRFEGGESGADVYDRVTSFIDTLYRDIDGAYRRKADAVVVVCHGLTMRLFAMRYLRWSVAFYESVANPRNCETWTFVKNDEGSYDLVTPVCRRERRHSVLSSRHEAAEATRRPPPVGRRSWVRSSDMFLAATTPIGYGGDTEEISGTCEPTGGGGHGDNGSSFAEEHDNDELDELDGADSCGSEVDDSDSGSEVPEMLECQDY